MDVLIVLAGGFWIIALALNGTFADTVYARYSPWVRGIAAVGSSAVWFPGRDVDLRRPDRRHRHVSIAVGSEPLVRAQCMAGISVNRGGPAMLPTSSDLIPTCRRWGQRCNSSDLHLRGMELHVQQASTQAAGEGVLIAGQFSDLGPVKELFEQTGLLVQQTVRANIVEEATRRP